MPSSSQQAVQGGRRQLASRQRVARTKPIPNFLSEADNDAAANWRRHQPFTDTVRLPADLVLQDSSYERHALEHGAYVGHLNGDVSGNTVELGIWGDREKVTAAKRAIVAWSEAGHKGDRQQKFHKLASLLPQERRQKEREYKTKVRQHRFRQFPPVDMKFEAMGSFHWPVQEYHPEEVFGRSCEALDAIRMDCSCYIIFQSTLSLFQVFGRTTGVKETLNRIRMTYFQIVSRMAAVDHTRTYILYWPISSDIPSHVQLEKYHPSIATSSVERANAHETHLSPGAYQPAQCPKDIDELQEHNDTSSSVLRAGKGIMRTLGRIHYYRGHIEIQVHLGRFILDQYQKSDRNIYGFDKYKTMMKDPQFTGSVTDEIGNHGLESRILATLGSSNALLKPADSVIEELTEISPIFSATFYFPSPSGDLRLEVTWQKVDNISGITQYELGETKWARLDRDSGKVSKLHEVSLIDLHTSSAWEFQILVTDIVDTSKIPVQLREFTSKLRLRCTATQRMGQGDPTIELPHFPKPKSYRQKKTYSYSIRDTRYLLGLTQFQDHVFVQSHPSNQRSNPESYEPRWALNLSFSEWKINLSENGRLPIGGRAEWSDSDSDWFPNTYGEKSESGFAQLVHKLTALTKRIYSVATEASDEESFSSTYQGMTIE